MTIDMTDSVAVRSEVKGSGRRDVGAVLMRIGKEGQFFNPAYAVRKHITCVRRCRVGHL